MSSVEQVGFLSRLKVVHWHVMSLESLIYMLIILTSPSGIVDAFDAKNIEQDFPLSKSTHLSSDAYIYVCPPIFTSVVIMVLFLSFISFQRIIYVW